MKYVVATAAALRLCSQYSSLTSVCGCLRATLQQHAIAFGKQASLDYVVTVSSRLTIMLVAVLFGRTMLLVRPMFGKVRAMLAITSCTNGKLRPLPEMLGTLLQTNYNLALCVSSMAMSHG